MKKTFSFDAATEAERTGGDSDTSVREVKLELTVGGKVEQFDLFTDLTGLEVLEVVASVGGGPGTPLGMLRFLQKVVKDEDWIRFGEATRGASATQIATLVTEVINLYADFPTMTAISSINGESNIGSTPESSSQTPDAITPEPALAN